jgi:Ca2+-binding EF-hand superfamily protein
MRRAIGLALVVLSFSGSTEAQKAPKPLSAERRVELFNLADKDADGRLEKSEWLATLPRDIKSRADADTIWKRVDKAGRGYVDRQTFVAVGRHPSE